jgi:hypothetical protein
MLTLFLSRKGNEDKLKAFYFGIERFSSFSHTEPLCSVFAFVTNEKRKPDRQTCHKIRFIAKKNKDSTKGGLFYMQSRRGDEKVLTNL